MNESLKIIKQLGLDHYLKIVLENSTSNAAPYHNLYHVLCKIKHTYKIAKSKGFLDEPIRILIIADLFHDFNHSMGAHDDVWNVGEAKKAFLKYSKETDETNEKVLNIISATQYPYIIKEEDLTLEQKITRDSDLLQQYEDNYIQQVYYGLSQELKFTFTQMLQGYPSFIQGMKLHTDYARKIHEELSTSRKSDVDYLLSLLEK